MNITFSRDGTKAVAHVELAIPNYDSRVFPMAFDCGTEVYAGLLVEAMRRSLDSELETIRRDEYESGWKDKAAHKGARRSWFATTFRWRNRR